MWDVLSERHRHLSAHEIAEQVRARDPGINVSSVYRTLDLFADLGLVRESRCGDDSASTWETSHADGVIHLVCKGCNRVLHHPTDLVDELHRRLAGLPGFQPTTIDVRVSGLCDRCATR